MTFALLGAHPALQRTLEEKGYAQPTPVQSAVLAPELAGLNLLVSAETGSGKTVAFGLAIAPTLLEEAQTFGKPRHPLALVIAPTRELAMQVQSELRWLYAGAGGRIAACVGGMDMRREMLALKDGAHIVVGTPGRLVDHLNRGSLKLDALRALILDEADEMLDMGFREDLEFILGKAPTKRRTLLFSATIPTGIAQLAEKYQQDAKRIAATPPQQAHRDIEYRAHVIALREREHAVVNVLRAHDASGAIVFCQTRESVNHLHANLVERGFSAVALSGELTQPERTRALKALRDGRARVLVATDVAARGLDLPDVGLVIHADLPHDAAGLQHRSGRTGRAGKKGTSVVLVPSTKRRVAEKLLREARTLPKWEEVPSADSIRVLDQQRIAKEIAALPAEIAEEDLAVARLLLAERSAEQLGGMLAALHRVKLPSAEELPLSAGMLKTPHAHAAGPRAAHAATPRPAPGPRFAPRPVAPRPTAPGPTTPHVAAARPAAPHVAAPRPAAPRSVAAHSAAPRTAAPHPASSRPAAAHPGASRPPAAAHPAVPPRSGPPMKHNTDGSSWFTINVGRNTNADPRWLVPLICRRGQVTKGDIGAIRIYAEETRIEISASAAARFASAARQPDRHDPQIRISPATSPDRVSGKSKPPTRSRP